MSEVPWTPIRRPATAEMQTPALLSPANSFGKSVRLTQNSCKNAEV